MKNALFTLLTFGLVLISNAPIQAQQTPQQAKSNGHITLDFEQVELRDLIRFMAETTDRNFIVDPKVGGKVTIISPRPVPTSEALSIFEGLLAASGFAIVPNGPEVWRVIPSDQAGQNPLDVIGVMNGGNPRPSQLITRLVRLKHVSANSIMPALQPLLGGEAILSAYTANNTLLITDRAANIRRLLKIIEELDRAADDRLRAIDIVYLRNADAPQLAEVINNMISSNDDHSKRNSTTATLAAFRGSVNVVADSSTNALLISAEPGDMSTLKDVIAKLDIRRLQVYLEALIMEVSSDAMNQFGVEWRATNTLSGDAGIAPFGGSSFNLGSNALASNPLSLPQGFSFGMTGGTIGFNGQEFANIGLLVRALQSDNRINILSTPQLLTLDNEEAEIIVGENVPFITGKFTNNNGNANPFQTIVREDVGLTLQIRPQIAENGMVRLNIFQEISSIAPQSNAADLITRKRSLKTTVMVPNDNMVVLGGLIRDDVTTTNQQVPCLASILGAGELFRSSQVQQAKTNLMVFIRPRIINNFGYLDDLSRDKYIQIRDLQQEPIKRGSKLVPQFEQNEPQVVPAGWQLSPTVPVGGTTAEESDVFSTTAPLR